MQKVHACPPAARASESGEQTRLIRVRGADEAHRSGTQGRTTSMPALTIRSVEVINGVWDAARRGEHARDGRVALAAEAVALLRRGASQVAAHSCQGAARPQEGSF
eukprot:364971-Chlamydomonas_euryale.AAC.21